MRHVGALYWGLEHVRCTRAVRIHAPPPWAFFSSPLTAQHCWCEVLRLLLGGVPSSRPRTPEGRCPVLALPWICP